MKLRPGMRLKENGTIEFRFTVDGKRYSVTGSSVPEVIKKQADLIIKISESGYKSNNKITLDDYFKIWLDEKKGSIRGSSLTAYESKYRSHVQDTQLGKTKVRDIERRQVIEFRKTIMPKVGNREFSITLANDVTVLLSMILSTAVSDKIINYNPAADIKALSDKNKPVEERKKPARETIHRALTIEETKLFLDEAKEMWYYELYQFLLNTGVRIGEACSLRWQDIDYKNSLIHITKTISGQSDAIRIDASPKSDAGIRDIPLTIDTTKVLKDQRNKLRKFGFVDIGNHVFLNTKGSMVLNHSVYQQIVVILKRINVDHFSTHCFRDTFATRYLEQGGNMNTLKTLLGHTSLSMTMDLYAHVLPNTKADEIKNMSFTG